MARRTQRHRGLAIGTPLGPDTLLLRSISGVEAMSQLFGYQLELLSEDHAISFDDIVGQNVTVRIECPAGGTRYINGMVRRFGQRRRVGRLACYDAEIVPALWMLTRTSDCRIFQEQKVPDIIKEVMKDHGITDIKDQLTGTYREWDYCCQYRETDFNFVSRLMEQEGIYYYFEHEDGKHQTVLCDAPTAHQTFGSYAEISYRPPSRATTDVEHMRDWRIHRQVVSGAFVHDDFDFENPGTDLQTESSDPKSHLGADFEIYDHPGEYVVYGDGQTYARIRMQELAAEHEIASGSTDARGACTGYKFSLTDFTRQDQNREHLVLSTSIRARSDEYDSAARRRGSFFRCDLAAIPSDVHYRPPRHTRKPLIRGVQTAIVVGPGGEEIYTDKYGRVKVQFHWDRRSQADETSSCWIRVTQPWAGKQWGAIHIPRIGQEVIVDFVEGDPDRPIITGTVYNGVEMPPYTLPKEKTRSGVKTNSSKGGGGFNEISMDDTKGKEQLRVHAEKDKDEHVKSDSREWIGNDRHLIIKRHQKEKVEKDKHLHVMGDHNEKVDLNISIQAGMNRQVKTGMSWAHEAGMDIHLKAGMNVVIEAGLQLTIKGPGGFVTIGPMGVAIQGNLVLINSGGAAGVGAGSSPDEPEDPDAAKTGKAGEVGEPPKPPRPPTPATYSSQCTVMQQAAASGSPFGSVC